MKGKVEGEKRGGVELKHTPAVSSRCCVRYQRCSLADHANSLPPTPTAVVPLALLVLLLSLSRSLILDGTEEGVAPGIIARIAAASLFYHPEAPSGVVAPVCSLFHTHGDFKTLCLSPLFLSLFILSFVFFTSSFEREQC